MESAQDKYIREHSSSQEEALKWIEAQTNIHTNYPRMLSAGIQGRLLTMLARISGARRILEIGTFTGYSATCFAFGIPDDGHIDTFEINDELEDLTAEGWRRAGVEDKITLHIGDFSSSVKETASKIISGQAPLYDIIYIDANKREYCEYFETTLPLLKQGGIILADDVLLGGKVYEDIPSCDKQTQGLLKFNDLIKSDPRVENVILPILDGLSIILKK